MIQNYISKLKFTISYIRFILYLNKNIIILLNYK